MNNYYLNSQNNPQQSEPKFYNPLQNNNPQKPLQPHQNQSQNPNIIQKQPMPLQKRRKSQNKLKIFDSSQLQMRSKNSFSRAENNSIQKFDNRSIISKKSTKSNKSGYNPKSPLNVFIMGSENKGSNKSIKSSLSNRSRNSVYNRQRLEGENDVYNLKNIILKKENEIKHLEEKIELLKEMEKTQINVQEDPNKEDLNKIKIQKLEKQISRYKYKNEGLVREERDLKNMIVKKNREFDSKIFEIKMKFEKTSRMKMDEFEKKLVLKYANRENPEINKLILELENLER